MTVAVPHTGQGSRKEDPVRADAAVRRPETRATNILPGWTSRRA
jgi:hypothetical protein